MAVLYVTTQGAKIKRSQRRIIVVKEHQILADIPIFQLDHIAIFGNVQLTTQAIRFLLENGINVGFFSTKGKLKGRLTSTQSKNIFLRLAQYDRWKDEQFKLRIAKAIITSKLKNQKTLLLRYQRNHPNVNFSESLATINSSISKIQAKKKLSSLMGLEGAGTAAYFRAFSKMITGDFRFTKRLKHPSPDPVNSLLSLGYTLVTNEIASLLEGIGFDPFLGFLHGIKYGRKSLALDLTEEFRHPVVDRFTLALINRGMFTPEHFEKRDEGVFLLAEQSKKYFIHFEKRVSNKFIFKNEKNPVSFRSLMQYQAEKLGKTIMKNSNYQPFTLEK